MTRQEALEAVWQYACKLAARDEDANTQQHGEVLIGILRQREDFADRAVVAASTDGLNSDG